ncbi:MULTISPECIES: hypothetical protein [Chryseobacterium]|uniref:hypothetical protein n=1 Tax=Chryseobacterium TaxID=59732 RepID=UPI00195EEEB9|nr:MULTISPECIES: hypothetical protein [Chryseobacterium]MBM7421438.1 hypothetical protein [Chryseobacterium sp. JUb44]MDH6211401.1 hypothetical protein [Chryseobacterium sp. BIGb0186]WSO10053.1 hypothetical protein VUJ64_19745 [Chryseobacterium scophthalmum]
MQKFLIIGINLFCCFLFFSCEKKDFGELNFINLRTQTIVNVSCEQLKTKYSTERKNLKEQESKKLLDLFKNLKKADEDWKTNARIFGSVKNGSLRKDFCMGNNIINIEGYNYFVDDSLRNYILLITEIK